MWFAAGWGGGALAKSPMQKSKTGPNRTPKINRLVPNGRQRGKVGHGEQDDGVTTMGLSRGRGSRLRNCGGSHEERSLEREWAETYRCCECRSSLMLGNWARMWRECDIFAANSRALHHDGPSRAFGDPWYS